MRRARLCLRLALVVSAILAGLLFAQFAHAQTALEWAAQGMGQAKASRFVQVDRAFARRLAVAEGRLVVTSWYGGVSRAAALTCEGGVRAGVAHMDMCIRKGARTSHQMMRCHNSGSPWGRVERAYRVALRGE